MSHVFNGTRLGYFKITIYYHKLPLKMIKENLKTFRKYLQKVILVKWLVS